MNRQECPHSDGFICPHCGREAMTQIRKNGWEVMKLKNTERSIEAMKK